MCLLVCEFIIHAKKWKKNIHKKFHFTVLLCTWGVFGEGDISTWYRLSELTRISADSCSSLGSSQIKHTSADGICAEVNNWVALIPGAGPNLLVKVTQIRNIHKLLGPYLMVSKPAYNNIDSWYDTLKTGYPTGALLFIMDNNHIQNLDTTKYHIFLLQL